MGWPDGSALGGSKDLSREELRGTCWGLTWPQLQQVVKGLDVALEVHGAGNLPPQRVGLRWGPPAPRSPPGLRRGGEQHRAEADCKVLVGHPVGGAEGGHQAEVVQQEGQRGLEAGAGDG